MTDLTPAAALRAAATALQDVAPDITGPLAGLADPVADWLDAAAHAHDAMAKGAASVWPEPHEAAERDAWVAKQTDQPALTVARTILGEQP
ncbi:hypothetical protein OG285_32470 [Streptomyces sp. NBC_01471]|uniref:hypothetical protein n=1 Tax=Streptomyces sp. NBC_01471 TaxID=2903879 RepID=UPI003244336E